MKRFNEIRDSLSDTCKMNKTEQLLLINTESKEHHQLLDSECEIGRGWLNVRKLYRRIDSQSDRVLIVIVFAVLRQTHIQKTRHTGTNLKRIYKIDIGNLFMFFLSADNLYSISENIQYSLCVFFIFFLQTHVNPIFYRTKIDGTLLKINKNDEPIVLSAGDSFGLFPNTFWFEIVKSNMQRDEEKEMAASASVVEQSPNESVAEVSKRKLPFWLAGKNYNKMQNDNNEVTVSNDNNIAAAAAATDGNSTQIDNPQTTVAVQDLALETPTIDSVSDDSATTKRKMSSMNDGNDNKRIRSDVNVASASNGSESGSVEPEMDTSNEPNIPSTAIGTRSDCAMEVLNGPIGESNASKPEDKALEPEPNERVEVHDATTENRTETSDAAVSGEPTTSVAGNPAETIDDDGLTVPLPKITIKTEPNDDIEQNVNDNTATAGPSGTVTVKEEIKTEVKLEPDSSIDSKPKRDCCPFGIRCYR